MQRAEHGRLDSNEGARYVREPVRVHFPTEGAVPETIVHLELRTALYAVMKLAFGERATIGSDQFVYWNPTDPSECLAPDVFVRLGEKNAPFDSWKVWERGAPHVAVEIVSESDAKDSVWQGKISRYQRCGVSEVVRFDGRSLERSPEPSRLLRVWNAVDGDLVERTLGAAGVAESGVLGAFWRVVLDGEGVPSLRLSWDAEGSRILPTPVEAAEAGRGAEAHARALAEARVAELEAELRRLRGG